MSDPENGNGDGKGPEGGTGDGGGKGADAPPPRPAREHEDEFPQARFKVSPQQIIPIFALIITLFAVIFLRKGCADGVATMFKVMTPPDAATLRQLPAP